MRVVVIRTSAMGDVALSVPVLKAMRESYPDTELVLVTRTSFKAFFASVPGLELFHPDLKNRHKGFPGIFRLFRDLNKQYKIDQIIDLHGVLRSQILSLFFRLKGVPVAVIDKGRKEKTSVITGKSKKQLKHTVERYCDVFKKAGFQINPSKENIIVPSPRAQLNSSLVSGMQGVINIGVAPFAKHKLKMWPLENMVELLNLISQNLGCRFWLFGGPEDSDNLKILETKVTGSKSLSGVLSLEEELLMMSRLDLMIAMDSSNMHMAALVGTKVISIWGGTDPLTGFSAWMQPDSFSIRVPVDELNCRPCTVYGKGDSRNGFACMKMLTPEIVYNRITKLVNFQHIKIKNEI